MCIASTVLTLLTNNIFNITLCHLKSKALSDQPDLAEADSPLADAFLVTFLLFCSCSFGCWSGTHIPQPNFCPFISILSGSWLTVQLQISLTCQSYLCRFSHSQICSKFVTCYILISDWHLWLTGSTDHMNVWSADQKKKLVQDVGAI